MTNSSICPRVSVLMTIYNAAPYLRESIDSVLAQSLGDWELITVENGSTDNSPSILAGYSDRRIRIFPLEKNIGRIAALRFAFDQARGSYIAVLDADDISSPDRLLKQSTFLNQHADVALVGSWTQFIDGHSKVFDEFKPPSNQEELMNCLGWSNPVVHSSAMYRRALALQVGGYPANFAWGHDFALTLALAQHSKIAIINDFLCQLRVLAGSMSRTKEYQIVVANENLMLFQQAGDMLPLSKKALRLNHRAIAIAEIKLGIAMLRNNSVAAGLVKILRMLVTTPSALWGNGPVRRFFGAKF